MTRSNPVTRRICSTTTSRRARRSVLTRWIRISAGRNGWCASAIGRLRIRLELEDRRALVAVDDPVELLSVRADVQRIHLVPALLAQRLPHLVDRRRIDERGERLTQDVFDAAAGNDRRRSR